jgi:hypothetical protein
MAINTMKALERFSLPLILNDTDSGAEWPPKENKFSQLHFQKSTKPGYVQIWYDGKWFEAPGIILLNGLMTLCPIEAPATAPGPRPLNPVR